MNIKPIFINHNFDKPTLDFIEKVENHYNVKFIVATQLLKCVGEWSYDMFYIFWQENPKTELGHTNYMGYGFDKSGGYIFNALPYVNTLGNIAAIMSSETGEVVYSKQRYDFVTLTGQPNAFIDGGRNYTRTSGCGKLVNLKIVNDHLEIEND